MTSTDKNKGLPILAILFWILVWHIASMTINNPVFLPSPIDVFLTLVKLGQKSNFYISILTSFLKILLGIILALISGISLAFFAYINPTFKVLIKVPLAFMKSVPVASFVILLLLWVKADNLSIIISLIMGLPIITENLLTGLEETDSKLLEMANSFKMPVLKKIKYIYYDQVFPYFKRALLTTSGLMFKAGIAAEVIGLAKNSIGENLYFAKIYLKTEELFAWTSVIIALSLVFNNLLSWILEDKW